MVFGGTFQENDAFYKVGYMVTAMGNMVTVMGNQRRRLRVASGATAPGPALEGALRFRPKVVLMSLSSYILR